MPLLVYFPADLPISDAYEQYFEQAGFALLPFQPPLRDQLSGVLLASPIEYTRSFFVSSAEIWYNYLCRHRPDSKLIHIAGLPAAGQSRHCLDWLHLPDDFAAYFRGLQSVKQVYQPAPIPAQSLVEVWRQFWHGHSQGGFFYHFNRVVQSLQMAKVGIAAGEELGYLQTALSDNDISLAASAAVVRWRQYWPYWAASPVYDLFVEADQLWASLAQKLIDLDYEQLAIVDILALETSASKAEALLLAIKPYFEPVKNPLV